MGIRQGIQAANDGGTPAPECSTAESAGESATQTLPQPAAAPAPGRRWIEGLAEVVRLTGDTGSSAFRTSLAAHTENERTTLFVPPEMPSLQPRSLRYLREFAKRNDCRLVEDRRQNRISPLIEQRDGTPPAIALGLALLMKQTGLPGPTAMLSTPHRLSSDSPLIDLPELIAMTAHAVPRAKRVVLLPNQPLIDVLQDNTLPITGYAAHVDSDSARTVLSHFDGPALRCLGYSTGRQYVMHVLLAGGPRRAPGLWTHPQTLSRTDLRFRLFRGRSPADDFGLMYSTFYYDLEKRKPQPWWLPGLTAESRESILAAIG